MAEEKQEHLLTEPEDIYGVLRKLVFMGSTVSVSIDGSPTRYSAHITSTDLKSRSFFMERVLPLEGNDLIRAGNRFTVHCDTEGIRIEFRMSGRLMYQPNKGQYRAEFPSSILYLQRRKAYRVAVPAAHQIYLLLKMADEQGDLSGQVLDMSSDGFKAKFKGNVKKRLQEQGEFSVARLRFNRQHDMDCSLSVHHVEIDHQSNTISGFSFTSVSAAAQRYLDRLITELQWEERIKREQQEESQDNNT